MGNPKFLHRHSGKNELAFLLGAGCADGVGMRWHAVIQTGTKSVHLGVSNQYRCPCCGYRTLAAPEALELCPVCWWEDDGQEDEDASEVRLTVNGPLSLSEARMHFAECGAAHPRFLPYVRKPYSLEL